MARLQIFTYVTLTVNVLYVSAIMYRRGNLPYMVDLAAIAFWGGQEYFALGALRRFARPTFSSTGELLDCPDAANPQELGFYSLAQDILWVCWVVQVLCLIHPAFFVFYLPVPATIMYKVYSTVIAPLMAQRNGLGGGIDEPTEQKPAGNRQQRRKEDRMQRKTYRS